MKTGIRRVSGFFFALAILAAGVRSVGAEPAVLTSDGAWCWFQDPRAVYHEGEHRRTYTGWITREGDLTVAQYDHDTGEIARAVLREGFQRDDHANPSFLVRPGGHLMVFYSKHNGPKMYVRRSVRPEDATEWREEIVVADTGRITYPNAMQLAAEKHRMWLMWRGETWKPTFSTSDNGALWSEPRVLIQAPGREGKDIRPYVKAWSDGADTIHLAFTDGHPRNEPENSIYYMRYRGGSFFRADGSLIARIEDLPIAPGQADRVYHGAGEGGRAWIWDVAADGEGMPAIVYKRHPMETDHRYHYARRDGGGWSDHEVVRGGGWFPQTPRGKTEREPHYSGGIVLDPGHPGRVYLCRQMGTAFELERWLTADGGATWESEPLTHGARELNIRPYVPRGWAEEGDHVLWMQGPYEHYTRFETGIRMIVPPPPGGDGGEVTPGR